MKSRAVNATLIPCRRLSIQDFRESFGEPLQCKRGVTEVERGLGKQPAMKCTWYSSGKEFARAIVMEVFEESVEVIVGVIIEEHLELQGLMVLMIAMVLELHSLYNILHCNECVGSNRAAKICYIESVRRTVQGKLVSDGFVDHFLRSLHYAFLNIMCMIFRVL
jgi:hypothetical protein